MKHVSYIQERQRVKMDIEIGSLFWDVELDHSSCNVFGTGHDSRYMLSGRTALDLIIKDIKKTRDMKSVYLPSYCCRTMIIPFIDNDVEVVFYDVILDGSNGYKYDIDIDVECDAVLFMQYFGFYCKEAGILEGRFKRSGKIVIEDATHSIFSDNPYSINADYVFVSFRKWSGLVEGGAAIKAKGDFGKGMKQNINNSFISMYKQVISMKKDYMEGNMDGSDDFLDLRRLSDELLLNDYQDYTISDEGMKMIRKLDVKGIKRQRRENACFLIDTLREHEEIRSIFTRLCEGDCPLYVPVHIARNRRDLFKAYLADKKIYCPSHWPLSEMHSISKDAKDLYENGLSLICDQRYDINDMKRIVEAIHGFEQII